MISTETLEKLQTLHKRFLRLKETVDLQQLQEQIQRYERTINAADFWNDPANAQKISQQAVSVKKQLDNFKNLEQGIEYLLELSSLETNHSEEQEIEGELEKYFDTFVELETQTLLSDEYDHANAILTLIVGNGGQDAEDFTQILYRMYLRYCEQKSFSVTILAESNTDDGLKSATLHIKGTDAYGMLKGEHGVHRLIRQSPFNAKGLRQTSFARIEVIPDIQQENTLNLEEKDLRIDVFRASGNGGQSVNTTDSAVRITYLPLGISVSCQNEKSQLQNKQTALKILTSRLLQLQREQQAEEIKQIRGDVLENSFGSQIRTYTLHPYKMVKDHRTNFEHNNPSSVFDGDLDSFIFEYLQHASKNQ